MFVAYTYFLQIAPTTYTSQPSSPLHTKRYGFTHSTRAFKQGAKHGASAPWRTCISRMGLVWARVLGMGREVTVRRAG